MSEWISVNDSLPIKYYSELLVVVKIDACEGEDASIFTTHDIFNGIKFGYWSNEVTHWTLLPEPPK